ncbi:MAG: zinc-binding alcohol dehydrogenase [Nakamurella sp.]
MSAQAAAFWVREPGLGEIRPAAIRDPGPGEVLIRTLYSGISRGTEALVFEGRVPQDQYQTMRAPFQQGDFPGPVKYGYLNVGRVDAGVPDLIGRTVFCLFPHQTVYTVPASAVIEVPKGVSPRRAVLTGIVETAVNALWDAHPLLGDRIAVVGAGLVGCCVARLAADFPGAEVTLIDTNPARAAIADAFGIRFATPGTTTTEYDVVLHASATSAGLQCALGLLAAEGRVIELSWYGDQPVTVNLGGVFHSRRLDIRASQVSVVSPEQQGRRSNRQRLELALDLLRDSSFDALLTGSSTFDELPAVMPKLADGTLPALCHTIDYSVRA